MAKHKIFTITPKHRRFVRFFILTGNITESAKLAGFNVDYAQKELIRYPAISRLVDDARQKAGLTDELIERKHVELMDCGDRSVELGATRLAYQVKKKIGSEDAPPPAVLPAVVIQFGGKGGATATITGASVTTDKQRKLHADGAPGVSIQRPNKS